MGELATTLAELDVSGEKEKIRELLSVFGDDARDLINDHACDACGVRTARKKLRRCGRCGVARYCSKECQQTAWKVHKETCQRSSKEEDNAEYSSKTSVYEVEASKATVGGLYRLFKLKSGETVKVKSGITVLVSSNDTASDEDFDWTLLPDNHELLLPVNDWLEFIDEPQYCCTTVYELKERILLWATIKDRDAEVKKLVRDVKRLCERSSSILLASNRGMSEAQEEWSLYMNKLLILTAYHYIHAGMYRKKPKWLRESYEHRHPVALQPLDHRCIIPASEWVSKRYALSRSRAERRQIKHAHGSEYNNRGTVVFFILQLHNVEKSKEADRLRNERNRKKRERKKRSKAKKKAEEAGKKASGGTDDA